MNLLYLGGYYKRFEHLIQCIDLKQTTKIVELAFGDIHIAKWAKSNNIDWIGFDINKSFVCPRCFLKHLEIVLWNDENVIVV